MNFKTHTLTEQDFKPSEIKEGSIIEDGFKFTCVAGYKNGNIYILKEKRERIV